MTPTTATLLGLAFVAAMGLAVYLIEKHLSNKEKEEAAAMHDRHFWETKKGWD